MKNRNAFTLVEVLVVVAIIALLAAIAIPNLIRSKVAANESAAQAALKTISNALESYAVSSGEYPPETTSLIGTAPPYLNRDYFSTPFNGYVFTATLSSYAYSIVAAPTNSSQGIHTFTISTGAVLTSI